MATDTQDTGQRQHTARPSVYDQHDKAFSKVSAYAVLSDGQVVATVAFKHPADGAGNLSAYVHWIGKVMVRGTARGYGYDKRSAAVAAAVQKVKVADSAPHASFLVECRKDGGQRWDDALRAVGFNVRQVV